MGTILLKRGSKGEAVKTVQGLLHLLKDGIYGPLTEEAVKEFQRANGLAADGVVGIKTWSRLLGTTLLPSKRVITEIIVHCAATPEGRDYTTADIERWHKKQGWSAIGYHYVVYRDGSVHAGRDIDTSGAHCSGHNTHSIGVCYIGGMDAENKKAKDTRTTEQKEALLTLLREMRKLYPSASIHSHRDFAKKDCPSFDATTEYAGI